MEKFKFKSQQNFTPYEGQKPIRCHSCGRMIVDRPVYKKEGSEEILCGPCRDFYLYLEFTEQSNKWSQERGYESYEDYMNKNYGKPKYE